MSKRATKGKTPSNVTSDGHLKAVIYIRESSDESVKNSNGPENQLRECRQYAALYGFEVVAVLSDEGISGKIPIADRPRGAELWRMVTNREVGAVIAARKDRYSRDEWGIELPTFLRHCTEQSVQVHAVHEGGHLRADMAGRVLASFGDIMGGEERKKNWERMHAGRRTTWERGTLMPAGCKAPFGFRRVARIEKNGRGTEHIRHDLEIIEAQADVVRECYRLLIEERLAVRQIALRMGETIPSMRHLNTLFRIFKNSIYKGEFHYGDFATIYREDLAIVDAETFAAAQEQLKQNSIASPRSLKNDYLLRMTIKCQCGRMLWCKPTPKRKFYDCPSYKDLFKEKHPYLSFDATQLDEKVWTELVKILSNRELLHRSARDFVVEQEAAIKPLRARLASYKAELNEAENDADLWLERTRRKDLGEDVLTRYELEIQKALDRAKEIKERIAKTERELATIPRYDEKEIDRVADLAARKFAHGAPTFEEKRDLVQWANLTGEVKEEKIEFKIKLGMRFDVPLDNLRAPIRSKSRPISVYRRGGVRRTPVEHSPTTLGRSTRHRWWRGGARFRASILAGVDTS